MTDARLRSIATAVAVAEIAGFVALVTITVPVFQSLPPELRSPSNWAIGPAAVSFAAVGALIVRRLPRHPVGWLLLVFGGSIVAVGLGQGYTMAGVFAHWPLPAVAWAMWIGQTAWVPGILLPSVLPIVYPDGRPISRGWLAGVAAAVAVLLFALFVEAFGANTVVIAGYRYRNPMPWQVPLTADATTVLVFPAFVALYAMGVAAFVTRWRRADAAERQQLKIFLYVLVVLVVTLAIELVNSSVGLGAIGTAVDVASQLATNAVPIAIGFAIFRYRLYDIDLVISRTLVYGFLAAFITAVYVAVVVGLGGIAGARADLPLSIAATSIVAVAFQPLRERLQRVANRLVYGRRATPYEVLSGFAHQLVGMPSVEDVLPSIARAAAEATGARTATATLLLPEGRVASGCWPTTPQEAPSVSEPVMSDGRTVGSVDIHGASDLDAPGRALVAALARQAALIYGNIGLTLELEDRLREITERSAEVRASRLRIVATANEQRRRLQREISEGPSLLLSAVLEDLAAVGDLLAGDQALAGKRLDEAGAESTAALEGLRDLARGVFPPLLVDQGLVPALSAYARVQSVPTEVRAEDAVASTRFDPRLEAAAYFCCVAALQQAARLDAERAVAELERSNGELRFTISAWGLNSRPDRTSAGAMLDRMDALGGALELEEFAGGAKLVGRVPIPAAAPS